MSSLSKSYETEKFPFILKSEVTDQLIPVLFVKLIVSPAVKLLRYFASYIGDCCMGDTPSSIPGGATLFRDKVL